MRLHWVLLPLLSALAGTADGARIELRQDSDSASSDTPATTKKETTTQAESTTVAVTTTKPPSSTSKEEESTSEPPTTTEDEKTVTVTKTVSGDVETISSKTTITTTVTSTVKTTETIQETSTETITGETSTSTVYSTTTVSGNEKREIIYVRVDLPAAVEAVPTASPYKSDDLSLKKPRANLLHIFGRDVTETVEVTKGADKTTVVETITNTVVSNKVETEEKTETTTETEVVDASETVTTTVIRTITSNSVVTSIVTQTGTSPAATSSSASGDDNDDESNNDNNGDKKDEGLTTGAKAGIGAGVGVAGLLVLVGLGWFCLKRRRDAADHDHDDLFPSSEVPVVGGGAARASTHAATLSRASISHQPSMSQQTSSIGAYTPTRGPALPNVAPEGYRGTAMGDGRAGYAKPDPYGSSYSKPEAYGSAYTRTSTGPSSVSPVSGHEPYAPPNRTSTYDSMRGGGDHMDHANIGVATSPVQEYHAGGRFSEMETQPYRPPYMDNVR